MLTTTAVKLILLVTKATPTPPESRQSRAMLRTPMPSGPKNDLHANRFPATTLATRASLVRASVLTDTGPNTVLENPSTEPRLILLGRKVAFRYLALTVQATQTRRVLAHAPSVGKER